MKKQAKIYLLGKDNSYDAIFSGTVEDKQNGYYVEYSDESGVACVIGYSKGIATITKTQEPNYTIILEENCPHSFNMETPFGNIAAVAYPIVVRSRGKSESRTLTLVYDLAMGNEKFRHNLTLKIEIQPD